MPMEVYKLQKAKCGKETEWNFSIQNLSEICFPPTVFNAFL